jgi:DNA topoisomerase-1
VKHGKVNATLPDQGAIGTITLEEAIELLDAKSGKGKSGRRKAKAEGQGAPRRPKAKVKKGRVSGPSRFSVTRGP